MAADVQWVNVNGMFDKLKPTKDRLQLAIEAQVKANPGIGARMAKELAEESLRHTDGEREWMAWEDNDS